MRNMVTVYLCTRYQPRAYALPRKSLTPARSAGMVLSMLAWWGVRRSTPPRQHVAPIKLT